MNVDISGYDEFSSWVHSILKVDYGWGGVFPDSISVSDFDNTLYNRYHNNLSVYSVAEILADRLDVHGVKWQRRTDGKENTRTVEKDRLERGGIKVDDVESNYKKNGFSDDEFRAALKGVRGGKNIHSRYMSASQKLEYGERGVNSALSLLGVRFGLIEFLTTEQKSIVVDELRSLADDIEGVL